MAEITTKLDGKDVEVIKGCLCELGSSLIQLHHTSYTIETFVYDHAYGRQEKLVMEEY